MKLLLFYLEPGGVKDKNYFEYHFRSTYRKSIILFFFFFVHLVKDNYSTFKYFLTKNVIYRNIFDYKL